jgi:hypothetical protein
LEAAPQIVHQPMVSWELSEDGRSDGLDVRVRRQIPVVGHLHATLCILSGEQADFQRLPEALLGRIADNPFRRPKVRLEKLPEALKGVLETLDRRPRTMTLKSMRNASANVSSARRGPQ